MPFPDVRISALNCLSSIATLDWAQRHYLRGPGIILLKGRKCCKWFNFFEHFICSEGVIEFLISREPQPEKECVYAKYRLVKIIVDSTSASKNLSPENLAQLKVFVNQGPFYAPMESAVATAGGSG